MEDQRTYLEEWLNTHPQYPLGSDEPPANYVIRMLMWYEPAPDGLLMKMIAESFGVTLEEVLFLAEGHILYMSLEQFNDVDPERRVLNFSRAMRHYVNGRAHVA